MNSILKTQRIQATRALTCLLASAALSGAGNALASTWTFNHSGTHAQGGVTATATAWANTLGSANVQLASAYLSYTGSSRLGIRHADSESSAAPHDAADNDARTESFLFSFAGDPDFSVYAYTGAGAGSIGGLTYSDLTRNGWTLVGHYNEASQSGNAGDSKDFPNTLFSSYWLIGAYNGSNADSTNDYFKLASVSGLACSANPGGQGCGGGSRSVPEPGTLLLVVLGLLGLVGVVRRRPAG